MNKESEQTCIQGKRNLMKYGWSLRACNGEDPDPEQIKRAATLLNRKPFMIDKEGFECEIFAATVHPDETGIVYLESRAKDNDGHIQIRMKVHYVDESGRDQAIDIESYNPYFGCDVGLIEWYNDEVVILIYREKHSTYVCRVGDKWPPVFAEIEDRWQIKDNILSCMSRDAEEVKQLSLPSFSPMEALTVEAAEAEGRLPPDPWG